MEHWDVVRVRSENHVNPIALWQRWRLEQRARERSVKMDGGKVSIEVNHVIWALLLAAQKSSPLKVIIMN